MQLRMNAWKVVASALCVPAFTLALAASASAQDAPRPVPPETPVPQATPGEPRTPIPQPLPPDAGQGEQGRAEPETRLQPRYQPRGGCRYRERTLELIV